MFTCRGFALPGRGVALPAVADVDFDGRVVGLEVFLAGSGLSISTVDLHWMDKAVLGHNYDEEEEILTIYAVDGRSVDQFSTQVLALISHSGELAGLAWQDERGLVSEIDGRSEN